jgi:hypothetical protein
MSPTRQVVARVEKQEKKVGAPMKKMVMLALSVLALVLLPVELQAQGAAVDSDARVARAMFTTKVENREPINRVLVLDNTVSELYFFSDLRHMQGHTITHRWEHEGKVVASKSFNVRGPRWRVYSSTTLEPDMLGQWTVVITDEKGWPLKAVMFRYVKHGGGQPSVILPPQGVN